jgi:ligand-binding SRPBCC domain-containing protein
VALHSFEVASVVPATPERVWERVTTFEGVNDELMPVARMTCPRALRRIDPAIVPIGRTWFRSWILLFGVVPFDYDDLRLLAIEPGRSFHEDSTMLTQRRWVHRRDLEPVAGGTRVRDRVDFEPRLPLPGPLLRAVFQAVFRHRHRRLAAHFRRGGTTWATDARSSSARHSSPAP